MQRAAKRDCPDQWHNPHREWRIVVAMWRLHVLADFIYWYGLLEIGLAMIDGSYYREPAYDDQNFPEPTEGNDDVD